MARKTLKQKLRAKVRMQREIIGFQHNRLVEDHQHAGMTINFETQVMQSVAMAHGVMASLILAKNTFDKDSEQYKSFEKVCQQRIAQCMATLVGMGLSGEEANNRIMAGH